MSLQTSKTSQQVTVVCDVCGQPIPTQEDGHVNWNGNGPFTFNHYGCGGHDVFNSRHYEYNTDLISWVQSLSIGCPTRILPTDPLKVSLEEWLEEKKTAWENARYNQREYERHMAELKVFLEEHAKRYADGESAPDEKEEPWVPMSGEELCNMDLTHKRDRK